MSKKSIVAAIAGLLVGVIVVIGLYLYFNYHTVTVSFTAPATPAEVEIYNTELDEHGHEGKIGQQIQSLTSGEPVWLHDGVYAIKTKGENFVDNPTYIHLTGSNQTINYDVMYSDTYLATLQPAEESTARAAILQKYPSIAQLYSFTGDKLLHQGDWYVVFLQYRGTDTLSRDTLRVALQKKDGTWTVATKPQIALGLPDYPSLPRDVLNYANSTIGLAS